MQSVFASRDAYLLFLLSQNQLTSSVAARIVQLPVPQHPPLPSFMESRWRSTSRETERSKIGRFSGKSLRFWLSGHFACEPDTEYSEK
ncbi:hypothetical protein L596_015783 [Steinernema carpocapsae]|uniref:Uncharacterized protein n=1 Tax=Steinernema carpocapsae TaxID=34508 RepID=A0A4U5NG24_STECR|nr:hypothetical protein L596_015783 [Steinernema carpocapsae]